jgi:glycosyltransferase involved in cell wall biosynthesis
MAPGPGTTQVRGRVLVITLADVTMDARILRQVRFLTSEYDVVLAAPGEPLAAPGVEFVPLREIGSVTRARFARTALRALGRYRRAYWLDDDVRSWRAALEQAGRVDTVIVNDLFAVPLALEMGEGIPVIYDAHEHWTSESASWGRLQRLTMRGAHEWIVDHALPRTAAMMTVSRGIAQDYEQRIGARPTLVTNAPFFADLQPSPVTEPIRLVHAGVADERRRLEDTIDAVRSLGDRFTLDLVLARDNAYRRRLADMAGTDGRIRILPPVPAGELVPFQNTYDVGVFLLPARFPNQTHVLPNKLFDYIQARLAIAVGPSPEMAAVIEEWQCGVVSSSFESGDFAAALGSLTIRDVIQMKENAHRAAAILTAENNCATVLDLVKEAGGGET